MKNISIRQQSYSKNKIIIKITALLVTILSTCVCNAQSPEGKWKKNSHVSVYNGQTFDSHKALLQQRPCASKIVWEINADGTFRLNAAASSCDEKYKSIQQKLYSKTKWKVNGNTITISTQKDFSIGQTYKFTIAGNKMTWTGTDGQGTIVYEKL